MRNRASPRTGVEHPGRTCLLNHAMKCRDRHALVVGVQRAHHDDREPYDVGMLHHRFGKRHRHHPAGLTRHEGLLRPRKLEVPDERMELESYRETVVRRHCQRGRLCTPAQLGTGMHLIDVCGGGVAKAPNNNHIHSPQEGTEHPTSPTHCLLCPFTLRLHRPAHGRSTHSSGHFTSPVASPSH